MPLSQADVGAIGRQSDYLQNILSHARDDEFWAAADHREQVADVRVPVSSIGGWYDVFLPGQLRTSAVTLRAADQEVHHTPTHPSAIILPVRTHLP